MNMNHLVPHSPFTNSRPSLHYPIHILKFHQNNLILSQLFPDSIDLIQHTRRTLYKDLPMSVEELEEIIISLFTSFDHIPSLFHFLIFSFSLSFNYSIKGIFIW